MHGSMMATLPPSPIMLLAFGEMSMRKILPPEVEAKRIKVPGFEIGHGPNGAFLIRGPTGADLRIIASDGLDPRAEGWEHVSVSVRHRIPNWTEMSMAKDMFFEPEETVLQLHVPRSQWIDNNPRVLHLWRHPNHVIPLPPPILVGIREDGTYANAAEAEAGYFRAVARGQV
jgi:hypothetical protein